jgi:hypothetical protein
MVPWVVFVSKEELRGGKQHLYICVEDKKKKERFKEWLTGLLGG